MIFNNEGLPKSLEVIQETGDKTILIWEKN